MNIKDDPHYLKLNQLYNNVGKLTWNNNDFLEECLNVSRSLFTDKSLISREPIPKKLEVFALVSGLPFSEKITNELVLIQNNITKILGGSLHYWVKPSNFGVEHCVFKWPTDDWDDDWMYPIKQEISSITRKPFEFAIQGIQINSDGCVVAKGYDEESTIFNIRKQMKDNISFLPKKQSGWSHIPIGRILEPIGSKKFAILENLISELSDKLIVSDTIKSIKFVHEHRWYMEEKSILTEVYLSECLQNE
jgi:hypothetical protein